MLTVKLTLADAADQYLGFLGRRVDKQSCGHAKYVLKMLLLAAQDIDVTRLSAKHIGAFWDVHRYWPRNARRYSNSVSDADLMLAGWNDTSARVSPIAIKLTAHRLQAFFDWLASQNLIAPSPQLLSALKRSVRRQVGSSVSGSQKKDGRAVSIISRRPFVRGGAHCRQPVSLSMAISLFQRASKVDGMADDDCRYQAMVMNLFLQSCDVAQVSEIGEKKIDDFVSLFDGREEFLHVSPLLEVSGKDLDVRTDPSQELRSALTVADQVLGQFFNWLWAQGVISKLPSSRYQTWGSSRAA